MHFKKNREVLDGLQRRRLRMDSDAGEASAERVGYRFHRCLHQSHQNPADVEEDDVEDAQDGSGQPDGEEGDEREEDPPEQGQRQSEHGRQQTVDPVAGAGEQDERRTPDRVESVRRIRLGNHIFKVQVDGVVDVLLVAVEDVESDGEGLDAALSATVARLLGLFLLLLLLFLLFLLLRLAVLLLARVLLLLTFLLLLLGFFGIGVVLLALGGGGGLLLHLDGVLFGRFGLLVGLFVQQRHRRLVQVQFRSGAGSGFRFGHFYSKFWLDGGDR